MSDTSCGSLSCSFAFGESVFLSSPGPPPAPSVPLFVHHDGTPGAGALFGGEELDAPSPTSSRSAMTTRPPAWVRTSGHPGPKATNLNTTPFPSSTVQVFIQCVRRRDSLVHIIHIHTIITVLVSNFLRVCDVLFFFFVAAFSTLTVFFSTSLLPICWSSLVFHFMFLFVPFFVKTFTVS